jgi:hypothetical protein
MWFSVALVIFGALLDYLPYLQSVIEPKYTALFLPLWVLPWLFFGM